MPSICSKLALTIIVVASINVAGAAVRAAEIKSGDYIVTQESPAARGEQRSKTAGAAIFLIRGAKASVLTEPPVVTGPRGIRSDRKGGFVFADPIGGAIRSLSGDGKVTTLAKGKPLTQPKDVALLSDGSVIIADFPSFASRKGAQILKLSPEGKITVLFQGEPLVWPHGVAVTADDTIIIADHYCCIYRLDPSGELKLVAKGGPIISPQDVKVDTNGSYVVTDLGLVIDPKTGRADRSKSKNPSKLLRIRPNGQVRPILVQPRARFRAVALGSDGRYLVLDMEGNKLLRVGRRGRSRVIFDGPPLSQPAGIVEVP